MPRAVVEFRQRTPFAAVGSSYLLSSYQTLTDSAGAFSIAIPVPDTGDAPYQVLLPDGTTIDLSVAAGAATTLETLLSGAGTASTRTIMGTLAQYPNAPVVARQRAAFVSAAATYLSMAHTQTTDATGAFSLALPVSSVRCIPYQLILPDGTTIAMCLDAGDPITLEELLGATVDAGETFYILLESGDALLLESGDHLLTEAA